MVELRAATSLARLWARRGERRKEHDLLAPAYGWFTEGLTASMVVFLVVVALAALHWLADLFWFQALGYAGGILGVCSYASLVFAAATCSRVHLRGGAIFACWHAMSIS